MARSMDKVSPGTFELALRDLAGRGKLFHVLEVVHSPDIADLVAAAEGEGWHVKSVWRGEASITYILIRYEAP